MLMQIKSQPKSSVSKKRFAICLTDSEPDLELRKVYQVLRDVRAAKDDYIRVVDESGEDYLYPASYFVFVEMPQPAERALNTAWKMVKTSKQKFLQNDPIVEETRKIRNRLAAKFKYDVKSLGAYYQAMQKTENRVVVTRRPKLISGSTKLVSSKFAASSHATGRRAKTSRYQQAVAAALS